MPQNRPSESGQTVRTGTLLVLGFGFVLIAGWFLYKPYIPAVWMHDFAQDIALRAAIDPNAKLPEDARQASPRGLADSPYICVTKTVRLPWDRLVVVGSGGDLGADLVLSGAVWPKDNMNALAAELKRDARYQLVVLLKDNTVVDAQLFFTFWGDLHALARLGGFSRAQAIFTATSKDGIYVVSVAQDVPPDACR